VKADLIVAVKTTHGTLVAARREVIAIHAAGRHRPADPARRIAQS
jgi:hypothetical protein